VSRLHRECDAQRDFVPALSMAGDAIRAGKGRRRLTIRIPVEKIPKLNFGWMAAPFLFPSGRAKGALVVAAVVRCMFHVCHKPGVGPGKNGLISIGIVIVIGDWFVLVIVILDNEITDS